MKSQLLFSVLLACACLTSQAQVIFQDGFETYADENDMYGPDGGWSCSVASETHGERRPVPVGVGDGVTPRSGSKMLDYRASALGFNRYLEHYVGGVTTAPITECSFWFNFGASSVDPMVFETMVNHAGGSLSIKMNAERTRLDYNGVAVGSLPITVASGVWYQFLYQIDWERAKFSLGIRGQSSVTRNIIKGYTARRIYSFRWNLTPLEILNSKYDVSEGAPGVFIDDFRINSVPEVTTFWTAGLGILACLTTRRRRRVRCSK